MNKKTNHDLPTSLYNIEVKKVYFKLVKDAKTMLATIEDEPLRFTLIREDRNAATTNDIVHELVSPLLYLRLSYYAEDRLGIHYGWELMPTFGEHYHIMNTFIRYVYKLTMQDATVINIQDCIKTDYVINECSAAYEHLEERDLKHHTFQMLPYKAKAVKRKLRKVA